MRTQLLCPVYRKWLQLHPEHAREERQALRKQARAYQRSGDLQKAFTFNQLVWEVAQSVLLALRPVDQYSAESQKDLVFFAASAIAVDRCVRANCAETTTSTNATAQTVITDTQQQLAALMPMYASEPRLMHIIQELMHWLKLGATAKTPPVFTLIDHRKGTFMNTVEQEFVSVKMRVSVLKRLLQGHNIHLCDVHGTSAKQKQCLQQLLLQAVSESK